MEFGIKVKDCKACENGEHAVPATGLKVTHSDKTGQLVFFKNGRFMGAIQAEEALAVLTIYWRGTTRAKD